MELEKESQDFADDHESTDLRRLHEKFELACKHCNVYEMRRCVTVDPTLASKWFVHSPSLQRTAIEMVICGDKLASWSTSLTNEMVKAKIDCLHFLFYKCSVDLNAICSREKGGYFSLTPLVSVLIAHASAGSKKLALWLLARGASLDEPIQWTSKFACPIYQAFYHNHHALIMIVRAWRCQQATVALLARRRHGQICAVPADVVRIIAQYVWSTRTATQWNYERMRYKKIKTDVLE